jgi:hypothetical protein
MNHLDLETLPEPVRDFFLSLPTTGEETVVDLNGRPYAVVRSKIDDPLASWTDSKNSRRFELIDKEIAGSITGDEAVELENLQAELRRYRRRVAPLPLAETRRMLEMLQEKSIKAPT